MEQKKRHRKVLRTACTRGANELEQLLSTEPRQVQNIQVNWELMQSKFDELKIVDMQIYEGLLQVDATEEDLGAEMDACDVYKKRYTDLRIRCESLIDKVKSKNDQHFAASVMEDCSISGRRKFKLPTIEFKTFDGNIRDWLSFWSQFKKIHEANDIETVDKIEYLIQATVPGSRARQLVESFPAMSENYNKIIDSMISRYGREDLQIEVYVRELLKLILSNASSQNKMDLFSLYDKIETQLRSLETLGITSDKCSAMLFPLIESCLPQELLRVWQRSSATLLIDPSESTLESRLKGLMIFLKNEVENEQRISLAAEGFGLSSHTSTSISVGESSKKKGGTKFTTGIPTAAELINCDIAKCVFCAGTHGGDLCFKAQKMSLEQKKNILSDKKACFRCLKVGHLSKRCRSRLKCLVCDRSHVALMCPELPAHKQVDKTNIKIENSIKNQVLTNQTNTHVFLQTLRVKITSKHKTRVVRALIDSGSQRSYILKSTMVELMCKPKRKEKIIHCLFGGAEVEHHHNCCDITLSRGNYSFTFEVLDQDMICSVIPPVFYGPWIEELRALDIMLPDIGQSAPIEILIGADVAGKIYTGARCVLQCGLVAVETFLGWTLMGRIPSNTPNTSAAMTIMSLLIQDASITNLWELDVLGIAAPTENRTSQEMAIAAKEFFEQTVIVNEEGRYEVRLPWIEGHPPIPSNYNVAKKRLQSAVQKLKKDYLLFEAYDNVFKEWLEEGIIEIVADKSFNNEAHYLPHRPVIKESSTTKIRPVFDASAPEKDKPSLNSCLAKGPNLIELIPSILLRFRRDKIGVVSDIPRLFCK